MQRFLWLQTTSIPSWPQRGPRERGCALAYGSQRKGENAVTRDYYQLTHEIAEQRGCDPGWARHGALFNLATWQTPRRGRRKKKKKKINILFFLGGNVQLLDTESWILILCYCKVTGVKYLYILERSLPKDFPPALCLRHPDSICFLCIGAPPLRPRKDCENLIQLKKTYIYFSVSCLRKIKCFPTSEPSFINAEPDVENLGDPSHEARSTKNRILQLSESWKEEAFITLSYNRMCVWKPLLFF